MSFISRQELEFLGEPLGDCVTVPKLGGGYWCGFGGGGGPTSSTVTQTNLPEYLEPYVMGMMGQATRQLFQTRQTGVDANGNPIYEVGDPRPYTPWSPTGQYRDASGNLVTAPGSTLAEARQYVAQPTGIQQNALGLASWLGSRTPQGTGGLDFLDTRFGQAESQTTQAGGGGQYAAGEALGYGMRGLQAGERGEQLGGLGAQYGGLGSGYGAQAAGLAPRAQYYGQAGADIGAAARDLATRQGEYYGQAGANAGYAASQLAPEAQSYGRQAANIGQMGLRAEELGRQVGTVGAQYGARAADVGGLYERMATSPSTVGRFMSPYQQAVIEQQQQGAIRQKQIADQLRASAAARAGAFGGGRQAIERAEADRALQSQLQGIEATGLQNAYQQAQQNIQQRAQLELQGLAGAQQGLGTQLQGGQLGLSGIGQAMAGQQAGISGLGQAGNLYGIGIQGAGMGLQGLQGQLAGSAQALQGAGLGLQGVGQAGQMYGLGMQGAGLGLQGIDRALAGTAQAMQGAGLGIQGAQAATGAYGLQGAMGRQMADLAGARMGQYGNIISTQYGLGEQQRQLEQQAINQAIQNFAMAQETPYQRLAAYNALMRGYSTPGQTMTQYQSAPSGISQLAGVGLAGAGLSGLFGGGRKAGGVIKARDGVDKLALNRALQGG